MRISDWSSDVCSSDLIDALDGTAWPAANLYDPDPRVTGLEWGRTGASSRGRTDTIAAYAFDTIKFGDRWQLNGGVRLDRYETDFDAMVLCSGRRPPAECAGLPTDAIDRVLVNVGPAKAEAIVAYRKKNGALDRTSTRLNSSHSSA